MCEGCCVVSVYTGESFALMLREVRTDWGASADCENAGGAKGAGFASGIVSCMFLPDSLAFSLIYTSTRLFFSDFDTSA